MKYHHPRTTYFWRVFEAVRALVEETVSLCLSLDALACRNIPLRRWARAIDRKIINKLPKQN